jgi:hypothetical protein
MGDGGAAEIGACVLMLGVLRCVEVVRRNSPAIRVILMEFGVLGLRYGDVIGDEIRWRDGLIIWGFAGQYRLKSSIYQEKLNFSCQHQAKIPRMSLL